MAEPQTVADPAKPKSAPPILMIVIALCSAASLGASTFAVLSMRGKTDASSKSGKHASPAKGEGHERARHNLGEFLVNLAEPDPQAFVKATIVVEYEVTGKKSGGHGGSAEAPEWEAPVRDAVVSTLSQCRRASLRSETGKAQLKERLLKRMNEGEDPSAPEFVAVYLTSFAMQ